LWECWREWTYYSRVVALIWEGIQFQQKPAQKFLLQTRHPAVCIRSDRVHPILVNFFVFGD
jgi:hypothetical protein